MKKSELVGAARRYLEAVAAGTDPVTGEALPEDSVGMSRKVREAAAGAAAQIGGEGGASARAPGAVDETYDRLSVLEDLAAGREPGTGHAVGPDDPLGTGRMRRCFATAAEALDAVFDKMRGRSRASFRLPADVRDGVEISMEPVPVTSLTRSISDQNPDPDRVGCLSAQLLNDYLEREGYLAARTAPGAIRLPTAAGTKLGLTVEPRKNKDGETYDAVLFSPAAQMHVIGKLDAVADLAREQRFNRDRLAAEAAKAAKKEAAVAKNRKRQSYGKQAEARLSGAKANKNPDGPSRGLGL